MFFPLLQREKSFIGIDSSRQIHSHELHPSWLDLKNLQKASLFGMLLCKLSFCTQKKRRLFSFGEEWRSDNRSLVSHQFSTFSFVKRKTLNFSSFSWNWTVVSWFSTATNEKTAVAGLKIVLTVHDAYTHTLSTKNFRKEKQNNKKNTGFILVRFPLRILHTKKKHHTITFIHSSI